MWHVTGDRWHVTCDRWHVTCDMGHMTHDTGHVTHDMWHMTHGGSWGFCTYFRSLANTVWERRLSKDLEEKGELMKEWNNYEGVCRAALATPVLLNMEKVIPIHCPVFFLFLHNRHYIKNLKNATLVNTPDKVNSFFEAIFKI